MSDCKQFVPFVVCLVSFGVNYSFLKNYNEKTCIDYSYDVSLCMRMAALSPNLSPTGYTVSQMPKYGNQSARLFIMRSKEL